ncbi:MFS transporter [Pseudomonas sp. 5P_3.1_Bac2]|uniref:MFS transporter n=1 Tax=Pseudomonas sp. 5P_3.1_Bac2 TaxID=2971617 RepID=UPI0021C6881C|nr:MFS transporter [Pseudomonas sp. 5P_3.1_Bac2]MCU1719168.1 MFS transporter [Pseudomonas sp. 5P_3.1_Bac2]
MQPRSAGATPGRLELTVIVTLYLAHALPLYFFTVALPAILRSQGVDLRWIGMLSLLYIPWAFKFLWAPLIDRYHVKHLGRRKTWLLLTQLALVGGVLLLALSGFEQGLWVFIAISLWISTWAATQDIAIDGYTVESLAPSAYRLGSMAQSIGVGLGSMVGGAGVLWLYQRYGWQPALLCLALLTALPMLAIRAVQEGARTHDERQRPSVVSSFKRPEMLWAFVLIVVYRLVEAPAMAMLSPLLIDQQWSLSQIGVLLSVLGALVGLLAAVGAARVLKHRPAERLLLQAGWLRTGLYLLIALVLSAGVSYAASPWFGLLVLALLAVRYLAMTSLYALFMRLCSPQQAGTDFTLLVCFELLVYFLGGALSGVLAKGLGYAWFYWLLAGVSIVSVLLSQLIIKKICHYTLDSNRGAL